MSDLTALAQRPCSWLASPGEHAGIVVSSRIRLARNCAGWAFHRTLPKAKQQELVNRLIDTALRVTGWTDATALQLQKLNAIERQVLVERQLISRDLAGAKRPAGVVVSADETVALMLNEEDHVRLQVITAGFALRENLARAVALDRALEPDLDWSFSPQLGYLTSCHTNLGTGLRASVMLHLPALHETGELKQVLRALSKLHVTVRGQHGEGSEAAGHYYQVSNSRSLGLSEDDLVRAIHDTAERIITAEQLARQSLWDAKRTLLEDKVFRAQGVLTNARRLSADELTEHLSWLRLGLALRVLQLHVAWPTLDRIFLQCQPAHLHLSHPDADEPDARDQLRATLVRQWLAA